MRDLTEKKRAEEERNTAQAALRNADRRKDEFLATLARELRSQLAPLKNALEILAVKESDRKGVSQLRETMAHQVDQLSRLVDHLMDVTRGEVELRRERVGIEEIIQSAVEATRPLTKGAGYELKISIPNRALCVRADPMRFTQVIANILNNAVKYIDGTGCIELAAAREGKDAVVRVRDTGIGIAPELLPKIFDLFAQADTSSTRGQPGLGIGLTLVKRLVELHGGTVEAHSEGIGKGSEFIVRLRLLAEDELEKTIPAGAQSTAGNLPDTGPRVLVVDDNTASADTLTELLGLYGYEAQAAYSGEAALDAFNAWRPDVVVLDIGMPDMDGYEVARRMREHAPSDRAMLIALTGWGQERDRERVREAGFDHHLLKPLDFGALRTLLAESQRAQSSRPSRADNAARAHAASKRPLA